MILEYHRPEQLDQALQLLGRESPRTIPLGGGTLIANSHAEDIAVVDLQALGLDYFHAEGNSVVIGAMQRMQALADEREIHPALQQLIAREFSGNLRQMVSIGGALVACDGRSELAAAFLAMDARMLWLPGEKEVTLGNFLPLRSSYARGSLLKEIRIPAHGELRIEKVARSPMDQPIILVAAYRWPSGRVRVTVGGFGAAPLLTLDGPNGDGAALAVQVACQQADDEWASGEYRSQVARQLAERIVGSLEQG